MTGASSASVSNSISFSVLVTFFAIYSTCQFLGAFAGGALGGWLLQEGGVGALIAACLVLATLWLILVLPARAMPLPVRQ